MNSNKSIYKVSLEFETTKTNLISLTLKIEDNNDTMLSNSETRSLILSALIDVMNVMKNEPINTYAV